MQNTIPTQEQILQRFMPKINVLKEKINNCSDDNMILKYQKVLIGVLSMALSSITIKA